MSTAKHGVPLLNLGDFHAAHRQEFLDALGRVIDDGRFLHGPDVHTLEQDVARLCQVEHAVSCASGSDALLLALMALDVGPGDEVICPSFTFFATASCIARLGATPVFVDILPHSFNIDPAAVEAAVTSRTKAIIPVHLFGQCAAIDRLCQIGARHGIAVIEDAAQAIGAAYHSRPAGSWGTMSCFSFYPTKNLGGMGDGGMLTTPDAGLADRLRLLAAHGMRPRYHHKLLGINSRLDSFQAAVLRVKLAHLQEATVQRQLIAARYNEYLRQSQLDRFITLPVTDLASYHVWNQYGIRVPAGRRDALREHLQCQQIGSEIYYPIPIHRQECFRDVAFRAHDLRETDRACAEVLHLPIYPGLTAEAQRRVVDGIGTFFMAARAAA